LIDENGGGPGGAATEAAAEERLGSTHKPYEGRSHGHRASDFGYRLEALHGDREGQSSIRINDQWRICFVWRDGGTWDVEIVDYH
jgi:RelE-like toxin of type II toxin-antitoxin system HigB